VKSPKEIFTTDSAKTILFIGNSLTYANDIPGRVAQLGKENGAKITTQMIAHPDYTLEDHWNSGQLQYQLAARHYNFVALACGLNTLYCSDYANTSFPMDSVAKIMMANRQMDMLQYLQTEIQQAQADFNEQLKTKTITQLLIDGNTDKMYNKLVGAYYFFLKAGDKTNHAGSFLASEQWRRNMYIYENILKNLDGKEKRILVLYGTTHVAMLKEMIKYNERLEIIPVKNVLK